MENNLNPNTNQDSQTDSVFSTRDLGLAASLISTKHYMVGVDYQVEGINQRLVGYFNFEDTEELRKTERDYMQHRLSVEPQQFLANIRGLKAQVNSVYKNPKTDISQFEKR